jgi:diadenosine tetraphosphate (Ap4A) HIT family hydrolase
MSEYELSYCTDTTYTTSSPPQAGPPPRETGDAPKPVERTPLSRWSSTSPQFCIFCTLWKRKVIFENDTWSAIWDGFPVTPGHALLIPKRHITSFFDSPLTKDEWLDMRQTLHVTESIIWTKYGTRQYNVGFNDGPLAGQTVPHLHIHVIPRYPGDVADPRGGIRHVIPDKAKYWEYDED